MLFLKKEARKAQGRISGTPMQEPLRIAVLDFDGTLTDSEKESVPFREKYFKGLARMVRITENGLAPLLEVAEKKILSDPHGSGWKLDGKIIAPAWPDPFIFATVTANEVLDMLDLLPDPRERLRRMEALFHSSYEGNGAVFRDGAKDFIRRLGEELELGIATSSRTAMVEAKLQSLGLRHAPPVFGDARKYVLDDSWAAMPESFRPEGYGRPVFLRRKKYWDILEGIRQGRAAESMIVVGDMYELDLALPQFCRMRTCLAANGNTPAHHIAAAGSGIVIGSLGTAAEEILQYKRAA